MLKPSNTLRHDEWPKTTSVGDEERISERRGLRQPRTEVQQLLNAFFEDEVERPPPRLGITLIKSRRLLRLAA